MRTRPGMPRCQAECCLFSTTGNRQNPPPVLPDESSPSCKNILVSENQKLWSNLRVPRSQEGASRSSRTSGAGCDGRGRAARRAARSRTVKPCGTSAADLKFLKCLPRVRTGTSNRKRHSNLNLASALCFPKFAKEMPRWWANFGMRALAFPRRWDQPPGQEPGGTGTSKPGTPGRARSKP